MILPTSFAGIVIVNPKCQFKLAPPLDQDTFALFAAWAKMDLAMIASKPVGADLLRLIGLRHGGIGTTGGNTVSITPNIWYAAGQTKSLTYTTTSVDPKAANRKGNFGDHIRFAGRGTSSVIKYINQAIDPDVQVKKTRDQGVLTPPFASLAHELIHAFHNISGNRYPDSVEGVKREELYTTGLGPYANNRISEAAIRKEHGLPPRTHYYSLLEDGKIVGVNCAWLSQSVGGSGSRV